jgi:4-aminobutyrate aminotransferase-like enzyme
MLASASATITGPFARVRGEVPGPRSRALVAREAALLAPGTQRVSQLAGIAIARGEGALVEDVDGNVFIDLFAGMGVASLGHGHPALVEALAAQAARVAATSFTSEARLALVENIARATALAGMPSLRRTQLYSGGAEAVESALRLARAATGRTAIVAFDGAFHGKSAGVAGLLGTAAARAAFAPSLPARHAPYPDPDRPGAPTLDQALFALDKILAEEAPAAVIVEPMQGTAGNVIPPRGFLAAVAARARAAGALLVVDEMITGWGRTGALFACAPVVPDILLFGKGVASGQPLSGLVTTDALAATAPWSLPSMASSSYGGAPLSAAAGAAVTAAILDGDLAAHAARVGEILLGELRARLAGSPLVRAVRGRGLLLAVDLDERRLDAAGCERLFAALLRRGLLTTAYVHRVRINPPLVITEAQAREAAALFADALEELAS